MYHIQTHWCIIDYNLEEYEGFQNLENGPNHDIITCKL